MVKRYQYSYLNDIINLIYDTIDNINIKDYNIEQINAWKSGFRNKLNLNNSFERNYTVVFEQDNIIKGFGECNYNGYLDKIYIHKNFQRKGIATILINDIENEIKIKNKNLKKIYSFVSITAKPFFEKMNYKVISKRCVKRNNIQICNFEMEKMI